MTTRILEVTKGTYKWYEVQVKVLGFIWLDANIYNSTYPNIFVSLETAMSSLDRLKKPRTIKKVVAKIDI